MPINYEKPTCDVCGHTVAPNERSPAKPLVRNQDGSVLCTGCMAKQKKAKNKPLL